MFVRYILSAFLSCLSFALFSQDYLSDASFKTTSSGLRYKITKVGSGKYPKSGDRIWVNFVGKTTNDSVFDSTFDTGEIELYLGQGQLIKGWEEGLQLIGEGGEITLVVPPNLGYGDFSYKGLPKQSTLVFDISLLQVDQGKTIQGFDIKGIKPQKTKDGLIYYVVDRGKGRAIKSGDNAYVHYTGFLSDGSIFDTSRKKGEAVRITVGGNQVIKGWDMGLQLMHDGAKFRLVIPPALAYGETGYKNIVPPNQTIMLDIEVVKSTPEIKISKWNAEKRDTMVTVSGLKYIVFNDGEGDLISPQSIIEVNYSGYFQDGTLFDSSVKREEPIKVPVGAGLVIEGWDEGMQLMRKGARFQFIIPPQLAYGSEGAPPQIPADATLIFDIEVLNIIAQ